MHAYKLYYFIFVLHIHKKYFVLIHILLTDEISSRVELFHCCCTELTAVGNREDNSEANVFVRVFLFEAMANTSCSPSKSCKVHLPVDSFWSTTE